jgi:hypothetical protein
MKLTVVFEDHRIAVEYANGVSKMVDFYTNHGNGLFFGNTTTKTAFTDTVESVGHNMNDYWAIQYSGGEMQIEYANGHPNQVVSGNTGLSDYVSTIETWDAIIQEEVAESKRLASIPTWDEIRENRNAKLLVSDKIIAWSTETGNAVPQDWTDYRQELRDITTTYGAPTGNTELVVWPTEPSWPTA